MPSVVFKLTEFVLLPQNIINLLVDSERSPKVGVLAPAPCYRTTARTIHGQGAITVPYNLSEEDGWELRVEELHRALESAKGMCKPVAIYITNPGNPAGEPGKRSSSARMCVPVNECILFLLGSLRLQVRFRAENPSKR